VASRIFRCVPVFAFALLPGISFAQKQLPELRARFEHTADPVQKAKLMPQIEEAGFQVISRNLDEGKPDDALAVLQDFRDDVQSCEQGLDETHINAEKHPNGFKQLEFALRESMRHLDGILVGLTADEQQPFMKLRSDFGKLNRHLMRELFPAQKDDGEASPN
jgi:hypothetical protein